MSLSNELIMRFVRATKDPTNNKSETTLYGTLEESGSRKYVRLDGSDLLTPVASTSDARHGDRVTVMIKNHTATVTGNLSSPSARTAEVENKLDAAEAVRMYATIKNLDATNVNVSGKLDAKEADLKYATIGQLNATNASVAGKLSAKEAEVKYATIERLEALEGEFDNITTGSLTAEEADLRYANIDFTNIGKAAMQYFYAQSGLIKNVVVGDQTITGELVGVTISGDRLIGNTVVAEKLVIKGSDGLYYKLNTDGMKVDAEQTDQNSLNGQIIKAKSITATKISVDDLVAFGATIGGFKIGAHSIYSGVKESVGNTTRGIYLDDGGQVSIGDSNNFLKYYKDTDGSYKLAISAKSLSISGGEDVESAITELQNGVNGIEIGGRNLYRNSSFYIGASYWSGSNNTSVVVSEIDGKTVLKCDATTTTQEIGYAVQAVQDIEVAKEYTVSSKIYAPVAMEIIISAWYNPGNWKGIQVKRHQLEAGWNNVSMTFVSNSSDPNLIVGFGAVNTAVFYIYHPQLERGNKATAWTLALEDNPNSYTTESYVNNSIDKLDIGGRNLVIGSAAYRKNTPISHTSSSADGVKVVNDMYMPCVVGETYTLQCHTDGIWGRHTTDGSGTGWTHIYLYLMTDANSLGSFTGALPLVLDETKRASGKRTWTFTIPDDGNVYTKIMFRFDIHSDGSTLHTVRWWDLKVERGDKATDWTPAPEDVDADISNASKTATNFISYDSSSGLQLGNKTGGAWSGFRTQITSSAFNILNSAGTTLASYGEKLIELGKNATDAVIKLCGGKGQIEYTFDEDTGLNYLQMSANKLRLKSSELSSLYSLYSDNSTRWEKSATNVYPDAVNMYASKCIDPTMVDKVEGWRTSGMDIKPTYIDAYSPGDILIRSERNLTICDAHGSARTVQEGTSGIWSYKKWSNGEVELWGTYTVSNIDCNVAIGNMYRTAVFTPASFPFTVYSPNVVASYESTGYGAFLWATTLSTTSATPNYYLIRPTSTTIASGKINFHVRGKWKT